MISEAILSMCISWKTSADYQKYLACTNALNAASIQTKIGPMVDGYEARIQKRVIEQTSELPFIYAGPVYGLFVKKEMSFKFRWDWIASEIQVSTDNTGQNLRFTWTF